MGKNLFSLLFILVGVLFMINLVSAELMPPAPCAQTGQSCGGISGVPLCCSGLSCNAGTNPDASGICVTDIPTSCSIVGKISNNLYCDVDGQWKSQKNEGAVCVNEFECKIQSCFYGKCQSKLNPLSDIIARKNLIQQIWDRISGIECTTGTDKCTMYDYFTCSSLLTWEAKGKVVGKCGWYADRCTPEGNESCGGEVSYLCVKNSSNDIIWVNQGKINGKCGYSSGSGGSGGGNNCTVANWNCTRWSNPAQFCGTRTCRDLNNCGLKLNITKFPTSKTCDVTPPNAVCGDGECNEEENAETCSQDCGACGDGTCAVGEDSNNCPLDCTAPTPHDYRWLFWIVVVILIIAIIIVSFFLYRRVRDLKSGKTTMRSSSSTTSSNYSPRPSMPPFSPFMRPMPMHAQPPRQPIQYSIARNFPIASNTSVITKEVIKEVPVEKEVIKEVPTEKKVYVDRPVYITEKRESLNIPSYAYLGSSETKTYHKHSCRLSKLIKRKYKLSSNSESFFKSRGFKRCESCFR